MRYRRKPATVEALCWSLDGPDPWRKLQEEFALKDMPHRILGGVVSVYAPGMRDSVLCAPGDWLLRYDDGTIESCKAASFAAMYEPVGESHEHDRPEPADHPPTAALPAAGPRDAEAIADPVCFVCTPEDMDGWVTVPPDPPKKPKARKKQNRPKA
jgi:hypothetical protein